MLALGFLSTFYYVFYGFWMGMKAMPVEYTEIMRNMDMGSVILYFLSNGYYYEIPVTLLVLGIAILITVFSLRRLTDRAVAKYTVDTDMPIMRRGKPRLRQSATVSAVMSINPLVKLAKYNRARQGKTDLEELYSRSRKKNRAWIVVGIAALLIFIYLLYAAYSIISSVSYNQWQYLFSKTPELLFGLLLVKNVQVAVKFRISMYPWPGHSYIEPADNRRRVIIQNEYHI